MTTTVPPKKNIAYSFEVALTSQADTDIFQASPTLATGDVQVSKDGAGFSNISSLPVEISDGVLIVALTATEMNADRVAVLFNDTAGSEWQDLLVTIHTVTANQLDDLSTFDETAILPDSVSTVGNRPTAQQSWLESGRFLQERGVVGTTLTVYEEDGITPIMTFTLDDSGLPTEISRET